MGRIAYDFAKSAIMKVGNNRELFIREVIKAFKSLTSPQRDSLINWLYFFTADKPEMQQWLHEALNKNILVS